MHSSTDFARAPSGASDTLDALTSTVYLPPVSEQSLQLARQEAARLDFPRGRNVTRGNSSFMSLEADRARRSSLEARRAVGRSSSSFSDAGESRTGAWSWVPRLGRFGGRGSPDQPDRLCQIMSSHYLPAASEAELAQAQVKAARLCQ